LLTQDKLQGLAFPLIKVRFHGPTDNNWQRWTASYDGRRITRPYDDSIEDGARNALPVAQELWERVLKENQMNQTIKDYILIPVNVDSSSYGFVPVEKYIIRGRRYF
jgi:hypothetical protein